MINEFHSNEAMVKYFMWNGFWYLNTLKNIDNGMLRCWSSCICQCRTSVSFAFANQINITVGMHTNVLLKCYQTLRLRLFVSYNESCLCTQLLCIKSRPVLVISESVWSSVAKLFQLWLHFQLKCRQFFSLNFFMRLNYFKVIFLKK